MTMTILSVSVTSMLWWQGVIISLAVGALFTVITWLVIGLEDVGIKPVAIMFGVIFVTSFLIIFGWANKWGTKETVKYKVTIDDSVSWNEINEKYEVVDTEGDIITLKMREE